MRYLILLLMFTSIVQAKSVSKRPTIEDLSKKLDYISSLMYQQAQQNQRDRNAVSALNQCNTNCQKNAPWPNDSVKGEAREEMLETSRQCHDSCPELPSHMLGY